MSSIPVRRSTRATSSAYKSSAPTAPENAHAKVLRTRTTTTTTTTTGKPVPVAATFKGKAKAETMADTKKPASKRPGLKDVTRIMANKEKARRSLKDKEEGPSKPTATTTKVVSKRVTRNTVITVLKDVKEESHGEMMTVDHEPVHPPRTSQPPVHRAAKRPSTDDIEVDAPSPKKRLKVDSVDQSQLEAEQVQDALVVPSSDDIFEPEYDPDGDEWIDIDADDGDDPAMVSEYVVETFQWLKETEMNCMPEANYMAKQAGIDWTARAELVDWIMQIHNHCRLLPETLFLSINILDRFLCLRPVSITKLQLVGVASFLLASKFEETYSPSVPELVVLTDNVYSVPDILKAERFILKTLEWNLSGYANVMGWLRRCSKADDSDLPARTIGKYLCEIACMDWKLLAVRPSLVAAASMWLARLILGREQWTANMAHYSSYRESEVIPVANTMLNYVLQPVRHEMLYKKYSSKRFLRCATLVRRWATDRWEIGTSVPLVAEVPHLKSQAKRARELKEAKEREEEQLLM